MSDRWLTLQLRAWRRGDEGAFTPRADMAADFSAVDWDWKMYGEPGPTWTLERADTGEVIGIGGGVEHKPGQWELWSLLAPFHWREWPSALACARTVMRRLKIEFGARRFTAYARADFPGAQRVLRRLGFELVGPSPIWANRLEFERVRPVRARGVR